MGGGGGTKQLSSQWGAMCLTTPIVSDWDLADGGYLGAILGRGPLTQRLVTILQDTCGIEGRAQPSEEAVTSPWVQR